MPEETSSTQTPTSATQSGPVPTKLDIIERISKIVSLAAIPIVIPIALAIFTAKIQQGAQKESINRDYVQLALSVLKEKKEDVTPGLRDWAVDLLDDHSPTKFAPEVVRGLKSGAVLFPDILGGLSSGGRMATVSADRRLIAVSEGSKITLTEVQTGQKREIVLGSTSNVVSLDFSPNGDLLAVGANDHTIGFLNTQTGKEVFRLRINQAVLAVKI